MLRLIHALLLLSLGALPSALLAQGIPARQDFSEVKIIVDKQQVSPGDMVWVGLQFSLDPGWHIYWQNPGDSGLPPTVEWRVPDGVTPGPIQWPVPKRFSMPPLHNYGYEGDTLLLVPVMIAADFTDPVDNEVDLDLHLQWLICNEICVPQKARLELDIPLGNISRNSLEAPLIEAARGLLPTPYKNRAIFDIHEDKAVFSLPKPEGMSRLTDVRFFPYIQGSLSMADTGRWARRGDQIVMEYTTDTEMPRQSMGGLLLVTDETAMERAFDLRLERSSISPLRDTESGGEPLKQMSSIWVALFFAFLGGILLNAMPCVFPVLSLKALAIAKKAGRHPLHVRREGIYYTLGVILSFLTLAGAMLILREGGMAIGWGFQLQSPPFIAAMIFLFVFVSLVLLGWANMPVLFGDWAHAAGQRSGFSGSFFTGVLAVLVATPCTVPFMAPALGYALTKDPAHALLIFATLGLGMAMPFLLVSLSPSWAARMPKPGLWMDRFKQFMAFPMLATAAWLLWVLTMQAGTDGMGIMLAALVVAAMVFWAWQHTHKRTGRGLWGGLLIATVIGCLVMLARHDAYLDRLARHSVQAVEFTPETLRDYRTAGRPVFVNATAAWCITCKLNERVALSAMEFHHALDVTDTVYMRADWTRYDDDITQWLQSFERSGVPFYVYYPPFAKPIVLPQLLTERMLITTVNPKGLQ